MAYISCYKKAMALEILNIIALVFGVMSRASRNKPGYWIPLFYLLLSLFNLATTCITYIFTTLTCQRRDGVPVEDDYASATDEPVYLLLGFTGAVMLQFAVFCNRLWEFQKKRREFAITQSGKEHDDIDDDVLLGLDVDDILHMVLTGLFLTPPLVVKVRLINVDTTIAGGCEAATAAAPTATDSDPDSDLTVWQVFLGQGDKTVLDLTPLEVTAYYTFVFAAVSLLLRTRLWYLRNRTDGPTAKATRLFLNWNGTRSVPELPVEDRHGWGAVLFAKLSYAVVACMAVVLLVAAFWVSSSIDAINASKVDVLLSTFLTDIPGYIALFWDPSVLFCWINNAV